MQNLFFTLVLSVLCASASAIATPEHFAAHLVARQNVAPVAIPASATPQCIEYSQIANLSTISANSTYRSAFLQASPVGTKYDSEMLNAAQAKLPALTINKALNELCGNLTTVALTAAEANFTRGVVAQFSGITTEALTTGPITGIVVLSIIAIMGIPWMVAE
ncbi:uncharacterized protein BCR38DRAFT_402198 [Pseudomassariella vexata]|uniref:Metal tolerance protein 3 n=1 Tax=Pseudomassariella vexata TaxID=1141098 RepID=A0A1Y2DBE0_9PEZI|nr:uncharacterized protein BCR38DRAFT_402198 [Pseudomassariella vexata]ORY56578.1 hypothetical protein BCR38DRAFT_402198 [Pseudomassariella vexata]